MVFVVFVVLSVGGPRIVSVDPLIEIGVSYILSLSLSLVIDII